MLVMNYMMISTIISDMMARQLFEDEYFMYGLEIRRK